MGPTPTPTPTRTLGMRLSCNFVNVYTTAYRVQHTCKRVHARIPTDILARKSARVGQKSADKSTRIVVRVRLVDPRAKVGEEVRVGVGVRIGPVEFKLN